MIDEKLFNQIVGVVTIATLGILTFLIIKPILLSAIFALILAFIFYPIYKTVLVYLKNRNLSAGVVCFLIIAIIIIPFIILTPIVVRQTLNAYMYIQGQDVFAPVKDLIKSIIPSEEIAKNIISSLNGFVNKIASSLFTNFTNILINTPAILLQITIILFVFFYSLRDGENLIAYLQSLSPLSKESEKKIFEQFKDITYSVIYGQILIGFVQGTLAGIAMFILGVPNALILTIVAIFMGILPIIGPSIVWIPVDLYLFLSGRTTAAMIFLVYCLAIVSTIDNVMRPILIGKRTKINSALVLVSMVGGLFFFGLLGLILGPLIISYLILVLETYRKRSVKGPIIIEGEK